MVELVVVILVIALLAAVGIFAFNQVTGNARIAAAKAELTTVAKAAVAELTMREASAFDAVWVTPLYGEVIAEVDAGVTATGGFTPLGPDTPLTEAGQYGLAFKDLTGQVNATQGVGVTFATWVDGTVVSVSASAAGTIVDHEAENTAAWASAALNTAVQHRTNLATNPSFEKTSGAVTVRTNLVTTVSAAGSQGQTTITGAGPSTVAEVLTSTTNASRLVDVIAPGISQNGSVAFSADVDNRSGASQALELALRPDVGVHTETQPKSITVPAGRSRIGVVWTAELATAPGDRTGVTIVARGSNPVGTALTFSNFIVENASSVQPYFDGATKPVLRTNYAAGATGMSSAAANGTNNIEFTGSTDASGVRWRTATFGARADASATIAWERWLTAVNGQFSPPREFQGRKITYETVVTASRDCEVRFFAQHAKAGWVPENPNGNAHVDAYSEWFTLKAGVPRSISWTWTPNVAEPGNTFNAASRVQLRDALSSTSDGTVITYREFDVYEGDYTPDREFIVPGLRDSTGLVCEWAGTPNASASIVLDPDLTVAWTGTEGASTSVLQGVGVAGVEGGIASTRFEGLPLRIVNSGQLADWPAAGDVRASIDTQTGRATLTTPDLTSGWYGRALIEDVTDQVPADDSYFDGDTPSTARSQHRWTGAPHGSTSTSLVW